MPEVKIGRRLTVHHLRGFPWSSHPNVCPANSQASAISDSDSESELHEAEGDAGKSAEEAKAEGRGLARDNGWLRGTAPGATAHDIVPDVVVVEGAKHPLCRPQSICHCGRTAIVHSARAPPYLRRVVAQILL